MIKSELVQLIASRNPHLFLRDVENIVSAIFEEITDALAEGNRIAVSDGQRNQDDGQRHENHDEQETIEHGISCRKRALPKASPY